MAISRICFILSNISREDKTKCSIFYGSIVLGVTQKVVQDDNSLHHAITYKGESMVAEVRNFLQKYKCFFKDANNTIILLNFL